MEEIVGGIHPLDLMSLWDRDHKDGETIELTKSSSGNFVYTGISGSTYEITCDAPIYTKVGREVFESAKKAVQDAKSS